MLDDLRRSQSHSMPRGERPAAADLDPESRSQGEEVAVAVVGEGAAAAGSAAVGRFEHWARSQGPGGRERFRIV